MNIRRPPDRTPAQVVEFVLQAGLLGTQDAETDRLLREEFNLSPDDAASARDRSFGGLIRAAIGRRDNCPDREKDPLAWESFQRGMSDRSLIERISPDTLLGSSCEERPREF